MHAAETFLTQRRLRSPAISRSSRITARLAPELRRSAMYAFVMPIGVAAVAVSAPPPVGTARGLIAAGALVLGCVALLVVCLTYRIDADDSGIRRRRLILRDRWTSEDFRTGAMLQLSRSRYRDARPSVWRDPIGRRALTLQWLKTDDADAIADLILSWLPPLPTAAIPPQLDVKLGFQTYRLDPEGVRICRRGVALGPLHRWRDIGTVVLTRERHDVVAARSAAWRLPGGGAITLRHFHGRPAWQGCDARTLGAFLERHVPADVLLVVTGGPARSTREFEHRRRSLVESMRKYRRFLFLRLPAFAVLLIGAGAWAVTRNGTFGPMGWFPATLVAALTAGPLLVSYGASAVWLLRRHHGDLRNLEEEWQRSTATKH